MTQQCSAERGSEGPVAPSLPCEGGLDAVRALMVSVAPQGLETGAIRGSQGPAGQALTAGSHPTTPAR